LTVGGAIYYNGKENDKVVARAEGGKRSQIKTGPSGKAGRSGKKRGGV